MQDWLQVAKSLPYGQHTKIKCCGPDNSCRVEHGTKGYRAWCFRCDPQDPVRFVPHGLRSVAELEAIRAAGQQYASLPDPSIPTDSTNDLPPTALRWLLSAGITQSVWNGYGIKWSSTLSRVVIPVRRAGMLDSVVMRSVSKDLKPKYLLKSRSPNDAVFLSDTSTLLPSASAAGTVHAFDIVIAEDVLSAIRIGRHCQAGALLGTSASAERIARLLPDLKAGSTVEWYKYEAPQLRIALWLDPDKAGRKGTKRLAQSLTLQGHICTIIKTEKDPKYYSDNQIRSILLARHCSSEDTEEPQRLPVSL